MILITGASSGIGEACAREFAARGKQLILTARRKDRLDKLSRELREKYSAISLVYELDVSDKAAVSSLVETNLDIFSQVEVLINNAGLAKGLSPLQEGVIEDWETMIDTNVKGLLYMTRALLPVMLKKSSGHIVNLGSVAGYWAYPKGNVYSATKFAVRSLTESLRLDVAGTGIRVTEIAPGMVETEFSEVRLESKEKAKAVYEGMKPLTPNDIAECIAWCVDRPKHVNIQELVVYPTDQAAPTVVTRKQA